MDSTALVIIICNVGFTGIWGIACMYLGRWIGQRMMRDKVDEVQSLRAADMTICGTRLAEALKTKDEVVHRNDVLAEELKELSDLRTEHRDEIGLLQKEIVSLSSDLRAARQEAVDATRRLTNANAEKLKELSDLRSKHREEMAKYQNNLAEQVARDKREFAALRDKATRELQETHAGIVKLKDMEIATLSDKHNCLVKRHESLVKTVSETLELIGDLHTEMEIELACRMNPVQNSQTFESAHYDGNQSPPRPERIGNRTTPS